MQLTLKHNRSKEEAIKIIDGYADELISQNYTWVTIVDPKKEWDENIIRFSFTAKKIMMSIEFEGMVIVTDQEAVLSMDLPELVERFVSEEEIKENITKEFNKLFNIN